MKPLNPNFILALITAATLFAIACTSTPSQPDIQPNKQRDAQSTESTEPPLKPLAFIDNDPVVTNLDSTADTQFYRVGNIHVIHKITSSNTLVSARLFITGGSQNLTDETAGLERLALASSADGGTQSTPGDEFNNLLDLTGSVIEHITEHEYSGYLMNSNVEHFDTIWPLFVQSVFEPAMPQNTIEFHRRHQLAAINNPSEFPGSQAASLATRMLFKDHPYDIRLRGTPETVENFTRAQLVSYQRNLITPERLLLVVVGNITQDDLINKVKSSFGKLAPSQKPPLAALQPLQTKAVALKVENRELPTNHIYGLFTAPSPDNDDYAPMRVAVQYLFDRLYDELRNKRNLVYSPNIDLANRRANYAYLYVATTDPAATMPIVFTEIDRLKNHLVTEQDLDEVRNIFMTTRYMNLEANAAQANALGHAQIVAGDWKTTEHFAEHLQAVRPEDVQRVVQKYFKNYQFGIIGNPDDVPPALFGTTE